MQTRRRRNSDVIITNIRYPATAALVLAGVAMNASALAFHGVRQPSSTSTLFRTLRSSDGQCSIGHAAQSRYSRIDTRDGAHGSSTACRMSTPISSTMVSIHISISYEMVLLSRCCLYCNISNLSLQLSFSHEVYDISFVNIPIIFLCLILSK